jgi:hypothetical protein
VKFYFLLSVILFFNHCDAQDSYYLDEEHRFLGMVTGGCNLTQVDGDNFKGYYKYGLNAGAGVYTMLQNNVAAGMEILYTQKGSHGNLMKESGTQGVFILKYHLQLNYAEVPVQLYYFDKHKNHFGGGFSYARIVQVNETYTTKPQLSFTTAQYPFKKSDINFVMSGNLRLWKGLYLTGRFQYSLISIRNKVPPGFGRSEQFNHLWTFRLMYLI